jgi:DNA replication protein DnaC
LKTICDCGKETVLTAEEKEKYYPKDHETSVRYGDCDDCRFRKLCATLPLIYRDTVDKYNTMTRVNKDRSYFFYGDAGSGKTFTAIEILKMLWKNRQVGRFISYPEFIYSVQTNYEENAERVDEIKKYSGLLILDDFGAEKMTDFVRQISYLIINFREQNRLQTIITSNFTLDEIDKYIDRRISSRIAGMCEIVRMSGDKRLKTIKKG